MMTHRNFGFQYARGMKACTEGHLVDLQASGKWFRTQSWYVICDKRYGLSRASAFSCVALRSATMHWNVILIVWYPSLGPYEAVKKMSSELANNVVMKKYRDGTQRKKTHWCRAGLHNHPLYMPTHWIHCSQYPFKTIRCIPDMKTVSVSTE